MSLSTSSSEKDLYHTPNKSMKFIVIFSILASIIFILGWEFYIRSLGYNASLDDSKELWSESLSNIEMNGIVGLGTSKSITGLHPKTLNEFTDLKVTQLSLHSTSPRKVLNYLANQTEFKGVVLMGMTELVFFADKTETEYKAKDSINFFKNYSLAQSVSFKINRFFDENLAFIEKEQFALNKLINYIFITDRENLPRKDYYPPLPKFYYMHESRFGEFIDVSEETAKLHIQALRNRIIKNNKKLIEADPNKYIEIQKKLLSELQESVQTIKERGGKVVLIKYPLSGKIKEHSDKQFPHETYWANDGVFAKIGFDKLIHYEDYEKMKAVPCCRDELHLTEESAIQFTKEMANILVENGIL